MIYINLLMIFKNIKNLMLKKAIINNNSKKINYLLKKGSDPLFKENIDDESLLMFSVRHKQLNIIKLLVDNGANINKYDDIMTPLMWSIKNKDLNLVKFLVELGADINYSSTSITPFMLAIEQHSIEIINYLLEKNIDLTSYNKYHIHDNLLNFAIKNGTYEIVKLLIKKINIDESSYFGQTPLSCAIQFNKLEIIDLLLKNNVNVNQLFGFYHKYSPLLLAVSLNRYEICNTLIEYGANINFKNYHNTTPLMIAMNNNNQKIFKLLLNNNADLSEISLTLNFKKFILNNKKLEKIEINDNCSICLEKFDNIGYKLMCNHYFHEHCFNNFINSCQLLKCPLCRKYIY